MEIIEKDALDDCNERPVRFKLKLKRTNLYSSL